MARAIDNIIEVEGALILGAGVAGLFTALKLAPFPSLILAGTRPGTSGSSAWAQGGIAAAMSPDRSAGRPMPPTRWRPVRAAATPTLSISSRAKPMTALKT